MKTVDKFERVASLAVWSFDAVIQGYGTAPSAYKIAKVATDLQRLSTTMKRLCTDLVNGIADESAREIVKKKRLRTLDKARKVASSIGLTCDESEDGMGYLEIFRPGNDETPIAVF